MREKERQRGELGGRARDLEEERVCGVGEGETYTNRKCIRKFLHVVLNGNAGLTVFVASCRHALAGFCVLL